jgi:aspartate oxidase
MYESFKEDTTSINKKIIKFLKKNIILKEDYFDTILSIGSDEENEINTSTKSDENEDEQQNEEEEEKDKKNKKFKKKKKKEDNTAEIEEIMKKKVIENKKSQLKELFEKIKQRHKEIIEKKPYYIYEPTLTSNTLLKDFEKEFWIMTKLNKCANCGAISAKFKKFNNLRFFRIMPSDKDKKKMAKIGIDVEKGALEHGASRREKEKKKKDKKIRKKKKKTP